MWRAMTAPSLKGFPVILFSPEATEKGSKVPAHAGRVPANA